MKSLRYFLLVGSLCLALCQATPALATSNKETKPDCCKEQKDCCKQEQDCCKKKAKEHHHHHSSATTFAIGQSYTLADTFTVKIEPSKHTTSLHLTLLTPSQASKLKPAGLKATKSATVKAEAENEVVLARTYELAADSKEAKTYQFKLPKAGDYQLYFDHLNKTNVTYSVLSQDKEVKPIQEELYNENNQDIASGWFLDSMVTDRSISEWQGEWQSVYPYLQDGSLDKVMAKKAAKGDKTKEEYKAYYEKGYATDISAIKIEGDKFTFSKGEETVACEYKYDGFKILDYSKGNRGVRYLFSAKNPVEGAPKFIQFSDHCIYEGSNPAHFHIFFGNESQEKLLEEMDNWPTYYPKDMSAKDIVDDMLHH